MLSPYAGNVGQTETGDSAIARFDPYPAVGVPGMTAFIKYVTFDCADPRRLAAFWSEVTGYVSLIQRDDFAALAAPDERGVRGILFWQVPEPKRAKSRMHVDLASKEPETEMQRLVGLGATIVEQREGNGTSWTVMLDPEGNEFCIG